MKHVPSFWVSNICNRNVSLSDLNLTIKSFSSVNLLDNNHYNYTLEQLQKSATSGSIFLKNNKISVRDFAPQIIKENISLLRNSYIPTRERSTLVIKEEYYDELNLSDEKYADEASMIEIESLKK